MNRTRIGANVKSRRKELRLTQADLAEMAHVSVIHISHIETGAVNMSLETLLAICYALGVTPNDILMGVLVYLMSSPPVSPTVISKSLLSNSGKNTSPSSISISISVIYILSTIGIASLNKP